MRRLLMATAILAIASGVAFAGPNAGVVLSVHGDQSGLSTGGLPCEIQLPGTCEELNPVAVTDPEGYLTYLVVVVSPLGNTPNFNTVVFGMGAWTPYVDGFVGAYGSCVPGALAVPTDEENWPNGGEGMALSWAPGCLNGHLEPVYFFCNYAAYAGGVIPLGPHPTQPSGVVDCSADPAFDPFDGFGGLNGTNPDCPGEIEEPGACCFGPTCVMCLEIDCVAQGGVWYGPDVCGADNWPCPQEPTPTKETTWGSIKNIYN